MASSEVLSCRDLACGYDGVAVVRGVDLSVRAGEIVTILGGSGSGKSTLLKTLAGIIPPLSGRVQLLGREPFALESAERRRLHEGIGMLYQSDALLGSMTVLENVTLPLRELTNLPPAVIELAGRARLALVDVLDIQDRPPSQISGGQGKRAALARATILDPGILFCDEPTSALDPLAAAQVDAILLRLRDAFRMAIVAVTHDSASVRSISDLVVALGEGGVRAVGTVADIEREVPSFFERGRRPQRRGEPRPEHDESAGKSPW